ncbi:SDR family oxidoreductase [Herbiconiux liukaitaii]|uniref:SDR family oxidoreductase n=1 Tax=Herbiconiux liukaitaii TaxID=3342799 RepID=UPI0035B7BF76
MSAETRSLSGTVVAITGASSGIGREVARQLVAEGARVALTARREERLVELETELGSDSVVWVAGDIADAATSNALVKAATEKFGSLDSLVASAGIGAYGGVLDGTDDDMQQMIDTNFTGTVWSVRAAVPALLEGGGDIVIVSSVAGIRGGADEAVYAGTKGAQVIFAGAIDRELRESGIRVTTVCPAAVSTEFAIGRGRTEGDAWLDDVLMPSDVALSIVQALQQPRRVRTSQIAMWSAAQGS